MNDRLRTQTRWLDGYTFSIPSKMWLSLAWSVIPKTTKQPYIKYIKTIETEEKLDFLIKRIRRHFRLSDNDWQTNRTRILENINANLVDWFKFYGIEKSQWRNFNIDFNKMREGNDNGRAKTVFDY